MDRSLSKILFLCAFEKQNNSPCHDPQRIIEKPYLEITSITDFCRDNSYRPIDHSLEQDSEAYQKTTNRSMIPDDIDPRLYCRHVLSNEYNIVCLIEVKLRYLYILQQRKLQIPNRHFFFKLCTNHYKLQYNEYFLTMFYTHTIAESLNYSDVDERMTGSDLQHQLSNFLDKTEQHCSLTMHRSKFLVLDNRFAVHIPVGDGTGGRIVKTREVHHPVYLNGAILLGDQGLQQEKVIADYMFQNKMSSDPSKLISRASVIITDEDRIWLWKVLFDALGASSILLTCMDDIINVTYELLLHIDFVIVTTKLLENKEYHRLLYNYRVANLSYTHGIAVMREEYIRMGNILEEVAPVLGLLTWHYIVFDNIRIREVHETIYFSFIGNHKLYLGRPEIDMAEMGIRLLFGLPMSYHRLLLTQGVVQHYVQDQIMIINKNTLHPSLLPKLHRHEVEMVWSYPEKFCLDFCRDTLKYGLARKLEMIPANCLLPYVSHIPDREELAGMVDDYYRRQQENLQASQQECEHALQQLEQHFGEENISYQPQLQLQLIGDNYNRENLVHIFDMFDQYLHYKSELETFDNKLRTSDQHWVFVFQQIDKLDTSEQCDICFDQLEYRNIGFSIVCGHIYCYKCLMQHRGIRADKKTCPACRRTVEPSQLVLYHRHPIQELPRTNSKLEYVLRILIEKNESFIIFAPQAGLQDLQIIQQFLSTDTSCAIFSGNIFERRRLIKSFHERDIQSLIATSPFKTTVYTQNVIFLRSYMDKANSGTSLRTEVPVLDSFLGCVHAIDQYYGEINVFEFKINDIVYNEA